GQRVARTAAIAIGCHHGNFGERKEGLTEASDALRSETVVVTDQDFQAVRVFEPCNWNIALGRSPTKGASLYCGAGCSSALSPPNRPKAPRDAAEARHYY